MESYQREIWERVPTRRGSFEEVRSEAERRRRWRLELEEGDDVVVIREY